MGHIKSSFTIVLILFLLTNINAQDQNNENSTNYNFKFAAKGGVNFSRAFGDIGNSESFLLDFHIGGIIKTPTFLNFDIQAEPQFSRIGSKANGKSLRVYTFLDIPILAQYKFLNKFSVEAGPKMAFTLSQKQRQSSGDLESVNRLKPITFGLTGGATYNLNSNWFSQFRVNYWFSDIIKKDDGDSEGTSLLLFQLSIGYWIN